ncbi:MAG TPA: YkvA family protein [Woeseiaceae bacterium]|nr:YkvA family protein [Woeseiaceae bacterium]
MSLRVSFDLGESDLRHFRLIMREARKAAANATPEDIVAGAEQLLERVGEAAIPQFIQERLDNLELMIRMLRDHEWRLPKQESARVLNALAYFSEPNDLIPDHIPGLGFLDDAIMIELVTRELRHELEAYRDFCDFRARRPAGRGRGADATREEWLAERRKELQSRMRRRRRRNAERPGIFS